VAPITLPESRELRVKRLYPGSIYKRANQALLIAHQLGGSAILPKPGGTGNESDEELHLLEVERLFWVRGALAPPT